MTSVSAGFSLELRAPAAQPTEFIEPLKLRLAAYAGDPAAATVWAELQTARHSAAAAIARLTPNQKDGAELAAVSELLRAVAASGAMDRPVGGADLALADTLAAGKSWPGLLAAMLVVPAWQWPAAPALADVPRWLWTNFVAYLFQAPQGFCAVGQAETYAAHYLRRLDELARIAEPARGSTAVRAALNAYAQTANSIPLYFSAGPLRRHAELRGRLLRLLFGLHETLPLFPLPRDGRRLRVGFVNRHFSPQTETYTTLPSFEQLDPERFEVLLFAHHLTNTPLEDYCRQHSGGLHLLPKDLPDQLTTLRNASLDVVVFGTNVTAVVNEVTQLALHRVAPLQVVNNSSCITSGLPEIDLYVSGDLTETPDSANHFTERLGLLPGPAHAFNYEADQSAPTANLTRSGLGIPEDAVVFVSAANYFKIIPEMREAWARQLAAVPGSYLLLHPFNPNWSSDYPVLRFRTEMKQVLAAHGVAASRLVLSTTRFPSRTDVKALLALGDIYLDTFPFGGVNSLVDPLEAGIPAVVWEGETMRSRMGAALLRSLCVPGLIAKDAASYQKICLELATDPARRTELKALIGDRLAQQPQFLDPLAASDLFGGLLEAAYDELSATDAAEFRRKRTPISVPASIRIDGVGRQMRARALLAEGRGGRAVDYLVAAVANDPNDGSIWFDLACALHQQNRMPQALEALEVALRVDPARIEAWSLMAELAERVGAHDIAKEARAMMGQHKPEVPAAGLPALAPAHLSLPLDPVAPAP